MHDTNANPTYSQQLVAELTAIPTTAIPDSAYDAAKRLLLDTLGCALAGRAAPGVAEVTARLRDWGGKPEASVLFADHRLPMPNAAFVNAAMIHALDLDDGYTPGTLHLTSVIVPAMLAAADTRQASGRDALAALILGIERAARLGRAEHARRRGGGFLPTSLAGSFGAVLAAAKLLGLSEPQTVHALGINYAQISGNRQALLDASLTKRLQPAFAVRSALWAVELARCGITGPHRLFEGEAGYFQLYMNGDLPAIEELLGPFTPFAVEHVSTKRYPSCGACHSVQIAAERLRREENLDPTDIAHVQLFNVAPLVSEPFQPEPNPQVAAQFCAAWGVAHTLLRGPATLADYQDDAIRNDKEVCRLAQRIEPVAAPDDLPPPPKPPPSQANNGGGYRFRYQGVIVHTHDGRRLMRCQAPCQTFALAPGDWDHVTAKFQNCASFSGLPTRQAEVIIERIKQLEKSSLRHSISSVAGSV